MANERDVPGVPPNPEQDEEWRAVVGYEGLYEISSFGRVCSVASGKGRVSGRMMKLSVSVKGPPYFRVNLWKGNRSQIGFVQHLVAAAFLGPRPCGLLVLHRDGNGFNNCAVNLYYGSYFDNVADAKRHGTFKTGTTIGVNHHSARLTEEIVREIRATAKPTEYGCWAVFARKYGVDATSIAAAYHRRTWKHVE